MEQGSGDWTRPVKGVCWLERYKSCAQVRTNNTQRKLGARAWCR
jgi:hypothetical protein